MINHNWHDIWETRSSNNNLSTLANLLVLDGFDTGFSNIEESVWCDYIKYIKQKLQITSDTSVFEVGCGAGAFLYPLYKDNIVVSGLDSSNTLINIAREVMPNASFICTEAALLDPNEKYDIVLSNSIFFYFISLDYVRVVLERMIKKARHYIAVFDIADLDKYDLALKTRRGILSEIDYEKKYAGLNHLYLSKNWVIEIFKEFGFDDIEIIDQNIPGYINSPFRFNVFVKIK